VWIRFLVPGSTFSWERVVIGALANENFEELFGLRGLARCGWWVVTTYGFVLLEKWKGGRGMERAGKKEGSLAAFKSWPHTHTYTHTYTHTAVDSY